MLVSLFGRPGAGKTTIGDALASRHGFVHLPMGKLLKDANVVREIGIDAEAVARAIATGRTINDPALYPWLDAQIRANAQVVVDGYPRGTTSLAPFCELAANLPPDRRIVALHLDCPPAETQVRLNLRARSDDDDRLRARDDEYERVQVPLLDQLTGRIEIVRIDAAGEQQAVWDAVEQALGHAVGSSTRVL